MIRALIKLGLIVPLVALPVWLAAIAYGSLSKRETTYRFIADALDPLAVAQNNVTWLDAETTLARPLTPADKLRAGQTLTAAWQALAAAQSTGRTDILSDGFIGVALERAQASVTDATEFGGRMSVLKQSAQPVFFHKDGSILQLELVTTTARYVVGTDGLRYHQVSRDRGIATLIQQTTGWRILSYERRSEELLSPDKAPWEGPILYGVNYYPTDSPWRKFWQDFTVETVSSDLDRIKNLGGNVVRIFLSYDDFLDPDRAPDNLGRLSQLLELAEAKNLWVIPTLFDLKPSFGPGTWARDSDYLASVLPVLSLSKRIAFIDLKNEADLDFKAHDEAEVRAWLRTMVMVVREGAPGIPVSIGWSSSDSAGVLVDVLDVVSYHEFGGRSDARVGLRRARALANGLPVIVSEVGASAYTLAMGFPGSETKQSRTLRDRMKQLEGSDGILVWTLFDFDEVDASVIGLSPWRRNLQSAFGLYKADGTEKPAARAVRQAFTSLRAD